jgi:hypothetical protein
MHTLSTRESLAETLFNSIAKAEGKDLARMERDYALTLIRDVMSAIDNTRLVPGAKAPVQFSKEAVGRI